MKHYLITILLLILMPVMAVADDAYTAWTDKFDTILKTYVKEGTIDGVSLYTVDYKGIRDNVDIQSLVMEMENLPPVATLSSDDQLAFWINAYNFLTIVKIVENPGLSSIRKLSKPFFSVWKQRAGIIDGNAMSLDEIEHGTIRKQFNEPRIHFAVNCASVGCPDLRPEAFRGSILDQQLEEQLQVFAQNDKKGVFVDNDNKTVYLSKILSWYGGDFPGGPKNWLIHKGILDKSTEPYSVKFFDYSWDINAEPGKN
jgi:hypothetical protein